MTTATLGISEMIAHNKSVIDNRGQRVSEALSEGDALRQGDIYLTKLDTLPDGLILVENPDLQLAQGTGKGSRHCLDSLEGVTMYRLPNPNQYDGPILVLDCERAIPHPEHGSWTLTKGIWAVGYQKTGESEEKARRIAD